MEQALQTMNSVVDRLQNIDPESLDLLKNAAVSLFDTDTTDDNEFDTIHDNEQLPQETDTQPELSEEDESSIQAVTTLAEQKSVTSRPEKQEEEITWQDIRIKIIYQPNYSLVSEIAHIEVYCDKPLPFTDTGYKLIFIAMEDIPDLSTAVKHVIDSLNKTASETNWQRQSQLSLL